MPRTPQILPNYRAETRPACSRFFLSGEAFFLIQILESVIKCYTRDASEFLHHYIILSIRTHIAIDKICLIDLQNGLMRYPDDLFANRMEDTRSLLDDIL